MKRAHPMTFVLIHGAGDSSWYWHLVTPLLRERGHDVVAVDLPCEDESAGWAEYTNAVVDAIGDRTRLVMVAQSFGGFTAPLVCARKPVDLIVFVAGMIPAPGEAPNAYWDNTKYQRASRSGASADPIAIFYHDVSPELAAEALRRGRGQADSIGEQPWP